MAAALLLAASGCGNWSNWILPESAGSDTPAYGNMPEQYIPTYMLSDPHPSFPPEVRTRIADAADAFRDGRADAATELLAAALELEAPSHCRADLYLRRGLMHGGTGNYREAISDYTSASHLAPTASEPIFHRWLAYQGSREFAQERKSTGNAERNSATHGSSEATTPSTE